MQKGGRSIFRVVDDKLEFKNKSLADYFKIFESIQEEKAHPASENFDSKYRLILKNLFPKTYHTALDRGKKAALDRPKYLYKKYLETFKLCQRSNKSYRGI